MKSSTIYLLIMCSLIVGSIARNRSYCDRQFDFCKEKAKKTEKLKTHGKVLIFPIVDTFCTYQLRKCIKGIY
ncbi:hypothetical protein ScPMuIL_006617 [Solemya velum]